MTRVFLCGLLTMIVVGVGLAGEDEGRKDNAGKPKEVSLQYSVSNSLSIPVDVFLSYQMKKGRPVTSVRVGTVAAGATKKGKERVVYNGLVGPAGKNGVFQIYKSGEDQDPLLEYAFYVENTLAGHNPKGNQVNSATEQVDMALLPNDEGVIAIVSVNPKHK